MRAPRFHRVLIALTASLSTALARSAAPPLATDLEAERLLGSINAFWSQQIAALGGRYRPAKLEWLAQPLQDGCGVPAALTGSFYCPNSESVYLDRPFLDRLMAASAGSPAAALGYVVAHEVAHHVQYLIGTTGMVNQARLRSSRDIAQRTLMTFELQADCYAGLWMRWAVANGTLTSTADGSALLQSVAAVSQQWQAHLHTGEQMLDPLLHGSADQRRKWLQRGWNSGQFNDCDTFGAVAAGNL
jgi:predicted metalloprotease